MERQDRGKAGAILHHHIRTLGEFVWIKKRRKWAGLVMGEPRVVLAGVKYFTVRCTQRCISIITTGELWQSIAVAMAAVWESQLACTSWGSGD